MLSMLLHIDVDINVTMSLICVWKSDEQKVSVLTYSFKSPFLLL